ncbi:MAG: tagaturonate reductase [Prevotellaceae bacterium]|nr:tagaturonate reductase [Prevotellaceae bacterium]
MKKLNGTTVQRKLYRERVVQFGEGNFLRAFVDWIVWNMNEKAGFDAGVTVVQPIAGGTIDALNEQDGLYHLILKGLDGGKPVYDVKLIDVVTRGLNPYSQFDEYLQLAENPDFRFIVSNTTEAGIAFDPDNRFDDAPAGSYPGKLVQLLYRRFTAFGGARNRGFIIFPCELIFENGRVLKACIDKYIEHWRLGQDFADWVNEACGIYSTLVDRIVPGYPRESADEIKSRIGFDDKLLVEGEIFHLWVIEAPQSVALEFPADKAGLNVLFVPSEEPYHERKVTLLNGPHTVLSPVGYLSGLNTVRECVEHETVGAFARKVMYDELLPTLNMPEEELKRFADDVFDRFRNPYVNHLLASIMLNAFPKFRTRDLPGLKKYLELRGTLPDGLTLGLAAIIAYYRGGKRGEEEIPVRDDPKILALLQSLHAAGNAEQTARGVLAADFIWGENLDEIPGLTAKVTDYLNDIEAKGMTATVGELIGNSNGR